MDARVQLGIVSLAGAVLGGALMFVLAPTLPKVPGAAKAVAAPVAAPEVPAEAAAPAPEAPEAAEPASTGEAAAPPPPAPTVHPLRPDAKGLLVTAGGPYPADVRGVGQLFRDKAPDIERCMTNNGPEAKPGETAVMVRLRIVADAATAEGGRVEKSEAVNDPEGRYAPFLTCLQELLDASAIQAPVQPAATVHWSVRRTPPG
jgi:hypothetical protein